MHGITSLDGHSKSSGDMNKAMERMSIVFKGRLSPEQLGAIKQDIQSTVMGGMLAGAGEGGDTMMAHMSPDTIGMAQEMGILPQGQMNETTGLPAFQGDNPGEENDDDGGTGTGTGAGGGTSGGAADGPADADLGATPQEVATMNEMAAKSAAQSMIDQETIAEALSKMTSYERSVARDFGFDRNPSLMASMANMTAPARAGRMDELTEARQATNPTAKQLDDLALTEVDFAAANPNMAAAMGVGRTIAGFLSPAIGIANMMGSVASGKAPGLLGGLGKGITDFGSGIASTLSGIADSIPGNPDPDMFSEPDDVGSAENEDPFVADEQAAETTLEENLGPDAERAKILGMGYSPADASLILDNFGTLDTFEQRFTGRFNRAPSPEMLTSPDARSFLNIQRGRPVGMGTMAATTNTGNRVGSTVGSAARGIGGLMT